MEDHSKFKEIYHLNINIRILSPAGTDITNLETGMVISPNHSGYNLFKLFMVFKIRSHLFYITHSK